MPPPTLSRALLRPSIKELRSFVLNPQSIRCASSSSQQLRYAPLSSSTFSRTITPPSRAFSSSTPFSYKSNPPRTHDRGPPSDEKTQTDFSDLDVLGNTAAPSTSIDACLSDGFHLDNGIKITDGDGVLLVAGEAFTWQPWNVEGKEGKKRGQESLVNERGEFEVPDGAWGLFGVVWPKPDLLILGLGGEMRPLSLKTKRYLNGMGIRVDVSDTRNAAAMFNLLATERGTGEVAAALVPIGYGEA